MNEEEIEERKDIDRLRKRFQNSMPNFLKGGNWMGEGLWWARDERKIAIRRDFQSFDENVWSW